MQSFTNILEMQGPDEPQHVSHLQQEWFRGWLGTAIHFQQSRPWKPSHKKVLMDSQRSETGPHQKKKKKNYESKEKMFGNKGGRKGLNARHGPTVAPGGCRDSLRPQSQKWQTQVTAKHPAGQNTAHWHPEQPGLGQGGGRRWVLRSFQLKPLWFNAPMEVW